MTFTKISYEVQRERVEVYRLLENRYQLMSANEREHFAIEELGVELGIWQGRYQNMELPWLRWWDSQGNLLLTGEERAEQERQEKEREQQRADRAESELQALRDRLRAMNIDPNVNNDD